MKRYKNCARPKPSLCKIGDQWQDPETGRTYVRGTEGQWRLKKPAKLKAAKPILSSALTTAKRGGARRTKRKGKYNANGRHLDGIWFASNAESLRYLQLKFLQSIGEIVDLRCQFKMPCKVNNLLVCTYIADFSYTVAATGRQVIEDVKGYAPVVYKLKCKLVKACYPDRPVFEIPSKDIAKWENRIP